MDTEDKACRRLRKTIDYFEELLSDDGVRAAIIHDRSC
jgi:hypothetical protein